MQAIKVEVHMDIGSGVTICTSTEFIADSEENATQTGADFQALTAAFLAGFRDD